MDINLTVCENAEEDYIDIEFCYSKEFEFQMNSNSVEKESTPSPADELFYKGKLLPLHLPPRLQMVQKLLQNSSPKTESLQEICITPFGDATPFDSCINSPTSSCRVSGELNPDEIFFECSTEVNSSCIEDHSNPKSWSKKLKLIKQSSLSVKLKASKAYFKSLFTKPECSKEGKSKTKDCINKYMKMGKKNPFGQIQRKRYQDADIVAGDGSDKEKLNEDSCSHRRSFSLSLKKNSSSKCISSSSSLSSSSSSSSSANSNGYYELHLLKRSSSANLEIESSVEGAIAYCKQSSEQLCKVLERSSGVCRG